MEPIYEPAPDDAPAAGGGAGGEAAWYGGSSKGSVRLCEVATGREVLTLRQPEGFGGVQEFAPDGRTVMTVTYQHAQPGDLWLRCDSTLHVWELATGKERLSIPCGSSGYQIQKVAFAPNGRTVATARINGTIQLWDLISGKELPRGGMSNVEVNCLAFSPDSQLLASAHRDGTILVWDSTPVSGHLGRGEGKANAPQLEQWWADLAGEDARRAYAAICELSAKPPHALRFLRDRLRPATEVAPDKLRELIADLNSDDFETREKANQELEKAVETVESELRKALDERPAAEIRQRLERVLRTARVTDDRAPRGGESDPDRRDAA